MDRRYIYVGKEYRLIPKGQITFVSSKKGKNEGKIIGIIKNRSDDRFQYIIVGFKIKTRRKNIVIFQGSSPCYSESISDVPFYVYDG